MYRRVLGVLYLIMILLIPYYALSGFGLSVINEGSGHILQFSEGSKGTQSRVVDQFGVDDYVEVRMVGGRRIPSDLERIHDGGLYKSESVVQSDLVYLSEAEFLENGTEDGSNGVPVPYAESKGYEVKVYLNPPTYGVPSELEYVVRGNLKIVSSNYLTMSIFWGFADSASALYVERALTKFIVGLAFVSDRLHFRSYMKISTTGYDDGSGNYYYSVYFSFQIFNFTAQEYVSLVSYSWSGYVSEKIVSSWVKIDAVFVELGMSQRIPVTSSNNGTCVIHNFDVFVPLSQVVVNVLTDWQFVSVSPSAMQLNASAFLITVAGSYHFTFISYDVWNYPETDLSRVSFHDSRGRFINFDAFHTYTAKSPSRLIRYAPDVNDPDLVAWFRFNEGTGTTTTDWKNGITGTIYGGATWTTGYISKALQFDGVDDYVNIVDNGNSPLDLIGPFTIEMWLKMENFPSVDCTPINKETAYEIGITSSGELKWAIFTAGTWEWHYTGYKINTGQWYHIAMVYDLTYVHMYVDGRLVSSITDPDGGYLSVSDADLRIGARGGDGTPTSFFSGIIDEVRIYSRALSPEEIWWHYQLVFYFDGYKDLMGRMPLYDNSPEVTQGVFGYARYFQGNPNSQDGSKGGIDSGIIYNAKEGAWADDATNWIKGSWTMITFAKADKTLTSYRNWILGSNGWHHGIWLEDDTVVRGAYRVQFGTTGIVGSVTASVTNAYTWHMYALTVRQKDDGHIEATLYVDGQVVNRGISTYDYWNLHVGEYIVLGGYNKSSVYAWYFEGWIDEAIVMKKAISDEMVANMWQMAKKYIGGIYSNTDFHATWSIESDSGNSGNGYAESFADVSDWSFYRNVEGDATFTTDGDVAVMYDEYDGEGGIDANHDYTAIQTIFSSPLDDENYPFFEIRWKIERNVTTSCGAWIIFRVTNGTNTYNTWTKRIYVGSDREGQWLISRINLKEFINIWAGVSGYSGDFDVIRIIIGADLPTNSWVKIYIDWLRIYSIEGATTWGSNVGPNDYLSSIGGVLSIAKTFSTTENEFYFVKWDIPDIAITDDLCIEYRAKVSSDDVFAYFWIYTDTGRYSVSPEYIQTTDWIVHRISGTTLKNYGSMIKAVEFGLNDYDNALASGTYYAYLDYVRIGYVQEQIQDTNWEPLLYPIYEHPLGQYVWFNVTDIWGNQLIYEPRPYNVYQDFVLPVYSWKFANERDDTFIHIDLTLSGSDFHWSEWLAPREVTEYLLYPGDYTLNVSYPDGSWFTVALTVDRDYFWMLEGDTLGDVLRGIDQVISNITKVDENVNQTREFLNNQIININVSLTNWNSEINNTVVNIYFNLTNMNSTLGDLVVNNQILIENMYSTMNNSFLNLNVWIQNNFTVISGQIVSVNNTVLNLNSTVNWQSNRIVTEITNAKTNMTTQFNWVFANITNLDGKIATQFNQLSLWIYNNFTTTNSMITSVNATVVNVNSTLGSQINEVHLAVVNLESNVTTQINWVIANVSNVNASILSELNTLSANIYNNFTNIGAQINELNVTVSNQYVNLTSMIIGVNDTVIIVNSTLNRVNATLVTHVRVLGEEMDRRFTYVDSNVTTLKTMSNKVYQNVDRAASVARDVGKETREVVERYNQYLLILLTVFGFTAVLAVATRKGGNGEELELNVPGFTAKKSQKKQKKVKKQPKGVLFSEKDLFVGKYNKKEVEKSWRY